ncbi:T-cell receptor gamma alternate reading frame protein [Lepus europaeus]|uniref:T-cell receptor gamma alternate reading frame protein n=1 Tax=Lepus europaeus TaxID=9983 RepID=UPI002B482C03|nr:T-cell receptor gamma alternate reading frame protein [Lepus europaeus]
MLWTLSLIVAFLPPGSQASSNSEKTMTVVTKPTGSSVTVTCSIPQQSNYIHWYRYQEGKAPQRVLYYIVSSSRSLVDSGFDARKYHADKSTQGSYNVFLRNLEESDSGVYYCAVWTGTQNVGWIKIFGKGTKLIVTPPDKKLDGDFSPKPTIFLPSIAETKLHKAGTYLCLLEKFFPGVIKVYWKEKNGDTILKSQEGNTTETKGTYMKFSWLTVPQKSFDKEHRCIVEHENVRGSKQEILFPAINKGTVLGAVDKKRKPSSLGSENRTVLGTTDMKGKPDHLGYAKDVLRLQLTNSSVYYTYLLLLLKSSVYLAIVTFSLLRRTAVCSAEKSS